MTGLVVGFLLGLALGVHAPQLVRWHLDRRHRRSGRDVTVVPFTTYEMVALVTWAAYMHAPEGSPAGRLIERCRLVDLDVDASVLIGRGSDLVHFQIGPHPDDAFRDVS